jgi:hypothetical protein
VSMWPDAWRETTMRVSGIPVTQYGLDVLSAWRRSTPLIAQTYNPLGMPYRGTRYPGYLGTPYAVFPGITAFADEFKRFTHSAKGRDILHVLISGESLAQAWRAIHALGWPANATETDHPVVLLDMLEERYRSKMATRAVAQRRTTGIVQAPPETHAAIRQQARVLHHAANHINDASRAISYIVRGLS